MPLVNLRMAVQAALRNQATHILRLLSYIPQTNEIGRSAVLIATALILEPRFKLPLIVSELGASAGLNLLFDQFALSSFGFTYQHHKATLTLTPDRRGPVPPSGRFKIAGHAGVDLSTTNPRSSEGFLRLCAYIWPDPTENSYSSWRVFAPRSALPLRKVMQLIGFASGSQQDILGISIWSSTQSHGKFFFPPNVTKLQASAGNSRTTGKQHNPFGTFFNGS